MDIHDKTLQKRMLNRLSRIEGQVKAIKRLVAESDDCEKVMQQMSAARKAMDKAFYEMLACVIEHEVVQDPEAASAPESMARVKSLLSRYS